MNTKDLAELQIAIGKGVDALNDLMGRIITCAGNTEDRLLKHQLETYFEQVSSARYKSLKIADYVREAREPKE